MKDKLDDYNEIDYGVDRNGFKRQVMEIDGKTFEAVFEEPCRAPGTPPWGKTHIKYWKEIKTERQSK